MHRLAAQVPGQATCPPASNTPQHSRTVRSPHCAAVRCGGAPGRLPHCGSARYDSATLRQRPPAQAHIEQDGVGKHMVDRDAQHLRAKIAQEGQVHPARTHQLGQRAGMASDPSCTTGGITSKQLPRLAPATPACLPGRTTSAMQAVRDTHLCNGVDDKAEAARHKEHLLAAGLEGSHQLWDAGGDL